MRACKGTVIGVIANGGAYIPVYRYTSADGQSHVAKSDTGSGWVRGKETGRVVPLMISAHNPTQAREASGHLLDLVGLVFAVPGVLFGYIGAHRLPDHAHDVDHGRRACFYTLVNALTAS